MNKQKWLKIVNVVLAILVLWLMLTAVLHDVLKENFDKVHPLAGFILVLCVIFHLILNWNWVKSSYFKKG